MEFKVPCTPPSLGRELRQAINERNLLTAKSRLKVCNMLEQDSPVNENVCDYGVPSRMRTIEEFIDSERVYLKKLEILINYFVTPLKKRAILTDSSHTKLFGQVEVIYNLNKEFFKEIEENALNIPKAILKMAPFFKLYSIYAFDYKNALLLLDELTDRNPVFRKFLQNNESRPEVQTKMNSLLIEPIQRVPRYKLLLERILIATNPLDPNYKNVEESLMLIHSICTHINSVIEDQEAAQAVINLQNSLVNRTPFIVQPSRKIIKEGILQKMTRNGLQDRYCVLMSDIFMYCKIRKIRSKNTLVENSLECGCIFPLKKCKVVDLFPGSLKIRCQSDGIVLCTTDYAYGSDWSSTLRQAIEEHVSCRKTLRKESSKRKPIRGTDIKKFDGYTGLKSNKRKYEYKNLYCNKIKTDSDKDDQVAPNELKRKPIIPEDNDQSFNLIRGSTTKSYFRANNVDTTILRGTAHLESLNRHKASCTVTTDDKENAIKYLPPIKKVKFEESLNMHKFEFSKPDPYLFTTEGPKSTQPTLRQRVANFFSRFF